MNILITGGASGLGEAITRKAAQNTDFKVYFTYAHAQAGAAAIAASFPNTTGIKCDFKNDWDVEQLLEKISLYQIDVLINNAYTGEFLKAYFHKTPAADFVNAFQENVVPTLKITREAIQVFRKKKFGKIITVLTAALANIPPLGSAVYVANKAYLEQLSKVWASENIKYNITSNTVSPAFMLTAFTGAVDRRVVEQIVDEHPLKTLLSVEEVADSILFLVNAGQQINGIDLLLNAGASIK